MIVTPIQAVGWPPEVKPEKGRASGTFEFWDAPFKTAFDFWNVGERGGGEYGKVTIEIKCGEKTTSGGWTCVDKEMPTRGVFSGGPNGKITLEGKADQLNVHLVNGKYIELTFGKTYQFPVENPEIFSKYDWGANTEQSPPSTFDENSEFSNPFDTDQAVEPITDGDENEAVITKIYGDVEVADKSLKKGIIQQGVDALNMTLSELFFGRREKKYIETGSNVGDRPVEVSDYDPSSKWFIPFKGLRLTENNKMRTGDGRAVIVFKDGTKFILRENSQIRFSQGDIYLENGKYLFHLQKRGSKMYIYSRHQKTSITGTKFEVTVAPDSTTLKVYEGSVITENLSSKKSSQVNAGEEVTVTQNDLNEKTGITGAKDIDMVSLEKDIVNKDFAGAKTLGMLVLSAVVFAGISVLVLVTLLVRNRKTRIIAILLLVVSAGLGIYLFGFTKSNNSVTKPPVVIKNTPIPPTAPPTGEPTATKSAETTNWKTYTDNQMGFAIKYPENVKPENYKDGTFVLSLWGPTQKEDTEFNDGVQISVVKKPLSGRTLSVIVEEERKGSEEIAGKKIAQAKSATLGGVTGLSYEAMDNIYYFLPIKSDSYLEILNLSGDPGNLGYLSIAQRILESLQII